MAECSFALSQDQIECSICLEPLTDPTTITCGHTYCVVCINRCWDEDEKNGVYFRCPQCRETFSERPALNKNTMLAHVVETYRERGLQPAPTTELVYPGPEDAACGVCTGRKLRATQSCLTCLASYCELHLNLHNELNAGSKHQITSATTNLQEAICTVHGKLLEVFCHTEGQFICFVCAMRTHKDHNTVPVAERVDKQRLLGVAQKKSLERIQRKEREAQDLRKGLDSFKESARVTVADCERAFRQLIECAERSCSEVTELIRDQQQAELQRATGQLEKLEEESREMKETAAEISKLGGHTDDHMYFIQNFPSLCCSTESEEAGTSTVVSDACSYFGDLRKSICDLQKHLQELCKQEMHKVSKQGEHQGGQDGGASENGPPRHRELEWRRQRSEERAPTHPTPPAAAACRRRRAASEEPGRPDPGLEAAAPPWRRQGQGHERRAREASPCGLDWRRSSTQESWRTRPHRREGWEGGSQRRQ